MVKGLGRRAATPSAAVGVVTIIIADTGMRVCVRACVRACVLNHPHGSTLHVSRYLYEDHSLVELALFWDPCNTLDFMARTTNTLTVQTLQQTMPTSSKPTASQAQSKAMLQVRELCPFFFFSFFFRSYRSTTVCTEYCRPCNAATPRAPTTTKNIHHLKSSESSSKVNINDCKILISTQ